MKPAITVMIIGWFFIIAGSIGFVYHLRELNLHDPFSNDACWVLFVRLLTIVGGVLVLRRSNTGRWLLVLWMMYHVVLSFFHTLTELITHLVIMAVIIIALFHPKMSAFFRSSKGAMP